MSEKGRVSCRSQGLNGKGSPVELWLHIVIGLLCSRCALTGLAQFINHLLNCWRFTGELSQRGVRNAFSLYPGGYNAEGYDYQAQDGQRSEEPLATGVLGPSETCSHS